MYYYNLSTIHTGHILESHRYKLFHGAILQGFKSVLTLTTVRVREKLCYSLRP